jgi:hypothetical protein
MSSTERNKILAKLMELHYREKYLELGAATDDDDVDLDFEPAIKAVKQWLEAKRAYYYENRIQHNTYTKIEAVDELLKELSF